MPEVQWAEYERANLTWLRTCVGEGDTGFDVVLPIHAHYPGVLMASISISRIEWRVSLTSIGASALPEEFHATSNTPMYPIR